MEEERQRERERGGGELWDGCVQPRSHTLPRIHGNVYNDAVFRKELFRLNNVQYAFWSTYIAIPQS